MSEQVVKDIKAYIRNNWVKLIVTITLTGVSLTVGYVAGIGRLDPRVSAVEVHDEQQDKNIADVITFQKWTLNFIVFGVKPPIEQPLP